MNTYEIETIQSLSESEEKNYIEKLLAVKRKQLEELEENLSVDRSYVSSVRAGKALIALGGLVLLGIPVAVITLNFPLASGLLLASPITSFLGIKGFGLVEGSDTLYTDQKNENKPITWYDSTKRDVKEYKEQIKEIKNDIKLLEKISNKEESRNR